jgi:hypothetical protein
MKRKKRDRRLRSATRGPLVERLTLRRKLSNLESLNVEGSTRVSNALRSWNMKASPSELHDKILAYSGLLRIDINWKFSKDVGGYLVSYVGPRRAQLKNKSVNASKTLK